MKRLMFFALLALLFTGCSSSTGGGSGAASSPNEVASIDLRIQVPDRQPRQGELALLIIRVVDADNLDLDVVSPIRVDLTGLTGSTVTQRVPGVAPGRRRVLVQALNAEGGLELAGDSGVVLLSPTEVRPVRIDLNPPAVRRLSFVNQPSSALVNTVLAPPVQVEIVDAQGQRLTSETLDVTLSLANNPGTASLGGTTTVTTTNGVATFSDLTVDQPGTAFALAASATGLVGATSAPFDVVAAVTAPTQLVFAVQPLASNVGQTLTPVQVTLLDASGVVVPTASAPVTLALGSNPGGANLGGTLTVNAVNGVATFSDLSLNQPGLGYTLTASSAGLTGAASAPFDIAPVFTTPSQLQFSLQPANSQARAPISTVQVEVQDAAGQVVTTATDPVTLTLGNNPGPATLSGTLTVAPVNGVATFSNVILSKSGTGYSLDANAPGLVGITSSSFDVDLPRNGLRLIPGQPFGPFANPKRGAITPNGSFLYVTEFFSPGDILGLTVDPGTGALGTLAGSPFVAPGADPGGVTITPDGSLAYVSSATAPNIGFYSIGGGGGLTALGTQPLPGGSNPLGMAIDQATTFLFVALNFAGQLESLAIGPPTLTPINADSVAGPAFPADVYLHPNGGIAITNTGDAFTITAGTVTLVAGSPFGVTGGAHGAAINPASNRFYSGDDSPSTLLWVKDINPTTGVMTDIPGSPFTLSTVAHHVAFSPDGTMAYTSDDLGDVHVWAVAADGSLTEIDDSPVSPGLGIPGSVDFITDPLGRFLYQSVGNLIAGYEIVP